MAADFTSSDLRKLADMLDALDTASAETSVTVQSYGSTHLTIKDHVIRLERVAPKEGAEHYVVVWPDET